MKSVFPDLKMSAFYWQPKCIKRWPLCTSSILKLYNPEKKKKKLFKKIKKSMFLLFTMLNQADDTTLSSYQMNTSRTLFLCRLIHVMLYSQSTWQQTWMLWSNEWKRLHIQLLNNACLSDTVFQHEQIKCVSLKQNKKKNVPI